MNSYTRDKVVLLVNAGIGRTYGLNIISSVLKDLGLNVVFIYLAEFQRKHHFQQKDTKMHDFPGCMEFSQGVIEDVCQLCKDALFVGISLLTAGFFNAVQLTDCIKNRYPSVPVLWGGKHAIINPLECLMHADGVFVGEAEHSIKQYALQRMNISPNETIPGLWLRDKVRNSMRCENIADLNALPIPDYGPEGHYVIENGKLRPVILKDIKTTLMLEYPTMIARGCPLKCTFCINSVEDDRQLRVRNVDNVVSEIKKAIIKYGHMKSVMFRDDTLLSLPEKYLKELSEVWKQELDIPFSSSGVIPTAVTETKLQLLKDAGFTCVKMGIQSGSERVRQKVFCRPETDAQVMQAAQIFRKVNIDWVTYMFITDNPWEEEDIISSLRMISKLPRPFSLSMYSLNLYPGTKLFERALKEELIEDAHENYNKSTMTLKKTYFNMLYMMQRYYAVPYWVMVLMTSKTIYKNKVYRVLFEKCYAWFFNNISADGVERVRSGEKSALSKCIKMLIDTLLFCRWKTNLRRMKNYFKKKLIFNSTRVML